MKRAFLILFGILLSFGVYSQKTITGTSGNYEFYIYKTPPKPPILAISNLTFTDNNGNKAIDANENCKLTFTVKNSGYGKASGIKAIVSTKTYASGISFDENKALSVINVGGSQNVTININSNSSTKDGTIIFVIKIDEPNGFGTSDYEMEITTQAFVSPLVKVTDNTITSSMSGVLTKKMPFDVQILVQNTKHGLAENVHVNLNIPASVICLSGNENLSYATLKAGETKSIVYSLIVSDNYSGSNIPVKIMISEKHGKYSENKTINLELNQAMASNKLVVDANITDNNNDDIQIASLTSDIDKNIPQNTAKSNRFALIIGNEHYVANKGLAVDVPFAVNDALIFKDYAIKILGVPGNQIVYLTDVRTTEMKNEIDNFIGLMSINGKDKEFFIYYAGHGFYDKNDDAYLMPIDVKYTAVGDAIRLTDFYTNLGQYETKMTTVFLDACFSGGGRGDDGLVDGRTGLRRTTKSVTNSGNIVVFAASSGQQTSKPYNDEKHGMFTYFLLKKLQETNGDISYSELDKYLQDEVGTASRLQFKEEQTPKVKCSPKVKDTWEGWRIK